MMCKEGKKKKKASRPGHPVAGRSATATPLGLALHESKGAHERDPFLRPIPTWPRARSQAHLEGEGWQEGEGSYQLFPAPRTRQHRQQDQIASESWERQSTQRPVTDGECTEGGAGHTHHDHFAATVRA